MSAFQFIILLVFFYPFISIGGIINVPGDTVSIQGGIALADSGDTVLVQPGHYIENINFNCKNITVGSLFLVTNNKSYISQTVIDGDSSDSVVRFESGEDTTSVLVGFNITNGKGGAVCGAECDPWGGGITCKQSNPTLSDLLITKNTADVGGGIFLWESYPKMINVTITENSAIDGGGINFGNFIGLFAADQNKLSRPKFDKIRRCNIFSNYSQSNIGSDLYAQQSYYYSDTLLVDVIVDTFSVLNPDSTYANTLERFNFDIKNSKIVTGIHQKINHVLARFILNQNYPNPFNPSTKISFTLLKSEFTELKIYNVLGKEISTLVSNRLNQGNHTYTFDSKNLSSGVYYYLLSTGDYRQVKKMILIR